MHWRILILICGLLLIAPPASALRCGSKLIGDGAPQGKVLKYCGEPESVQARSILRAGFPRYRVRNRIGRIGTSTNADRELLFADRAYVEVQVEEWTYNFGPRRLMRVIRFENGLVTAINQLGYGY